MIRDRIKLHRAKMNSEKRDDTINACFYVEIENKGGWSWDEVKKHQVEAVMIYHGVVKARAIEAFVMKPLDKSYDDVKKELIAAYGTMASSVIEGAYLDYVDEKAKGYCSLSEEKDKKKNAICRRCYYWNFDNLLNPEFVSALYIERAKRSGDVVSKQSVDSITNTGLETITTMPDDLFVDIIGEIERRQDENVKQREANFAKSKRKVA